MDWMDSAEKWDVDALRARGRGDDAAARRAESAAHRCRMRHDEARQ